MTAKNFRITPADQRTSVEGKQITNKVLLAIPDNEYELMRPDLAYIDLPHHLSLHEPTQTLEFAYFPNRGMVSQVVVTKDGQTVEVGVVGKEGFVGAGLAVGLTRSSVREVIQIAGDGFRVMGNALERILRSAPQLQVILNRHTGLQGMQVAQTAACNRLHDIQQRLSRWLLMTQDRVGASIASHHPRFHCDDDGHRPIHGEPGSVTHAKKRNHRLRPRRSEDCEPQETRKIRL